MGSNSFLAENFHSLYSFPIYTHHRTSASITYILFRFKAHKLHHTWEIKSNETARELCESHAICRSWFTFNPSKISESTQSLALINGLPDSFYQIKKFKPYEISEKAKFKSFQAGIEGLDLLRDFTCDVICITSHHSYFALINEFWILGNVNLSPIII